MNNLLKLTGAIIGNIVALASFMTEFKPDVFADMKFKTEDK